MEHEPTDTTPSHSPALSTFITNGATLSILGRICCKSIELKDDSTLIMEPGAEFIQDADGGHIKITMGHGARILDAFGEDYELPLFVDVIGSEEGLPAFTE